MIGPLSALRGEPAPGLDDLRQARAARLAPLPAGRIFFRGARVQGPASFRSRVTLVLSLPKALFRGQRLPVFRLQGRRWLPLAQPAVVGSDNMTAAATITQPGNYAVFLGKLWRTVRRDGYRLVRYFGRIPRTVLRSPQVVAEGKVDDPQLIAAVAAAGGRNEAWAKSTLRSYDTYRRPDSPGPQARLAAHPGAQLEPALDRRTLVRPLRGRALSTAAGTYRLRPAEQQHRDGRHPAPSASRAPSSSRASAPT